MEVITKEAALKIAYAHIEIEKAEKLLLDISDSKRWGHTPESLKDAFGRTHRGYQLGIPSGSGGHTLYEVSPELSKYVIEAHLAQKKKELVEACQVARMQFDGLLEPKTEQQEQK